MTPPLTDEEQDSAIFALGNAVAQLANGISLITDALNNELATCVITTAK